MISHCRFINPVVVAPTIAGVGLAFFTYGFPQAGSCVEISIPQILLVLIFTLVGLQLNFIQSHLIIIPTPSFPTQMLERYQLHRVLVLLAQIYRTLQIGLTIPPYSSTDSRLHFWKQYLIIKLALPMLSTIAGSPEHSDYMGICVLFDCWTDVSNAWRTAAWVRIPYPLQWGVPSFHLRTSIIMIIVSLVASVDSVGTYHSTSLLVNSKPPTPGIVSRGIGLEGFCSVLAGLWGSGTGSTTLTENVHTINITKMASRRAVELGAAFLIFLSFIGKVGAILASIPQALAASVLCFMWALIVALGLSTLQYSQAASFRNMTIVGVSLFLGLSVPAYFQQYQLYTSLILPSYFIPYAAASNGPVHTGSKQLDFAFNALLSMNMVVTLLVALVLDNTVPGSRQERGVYIWSRAEEMETDPSFLADYSLPKKIAPAFCRTKCLGS
ncbi:Nucleobase-ascorbate transporter 11 [Vitis vinifera]|uniref:Nucleobase-ascorbate transporter 11 n=1 Tax=Vitis vinifera TaxID=29760 RepID=A0A438KR00_VITVI|nr:Nucleobase-ascorbate transporter 11 [Vitis vinifera]